MSSWCSQFFPNICLYHADLMKSLEKKLRVQFCSFVKLFAWCHRHSHNLPFGVVKHQLRQNFTQGVNTFRSVYCFKLDKCPTEEAGGVVADIVTYVIINTTSTTSTLTLHIKKLCKNVYCMMLPQRELIMINLT